MNHLYQIELLGGIRIKFEGQTVARFRTQKTAALLAYLACFPRRAHLREELIELFWPDTDEEAGRMSLRTALSSLRRQLELPGGASSEVLIADRLQVQLDPEIISTDVAQFENAIKAAERNPEDARRIENLMHAVDLYCGPLLPGFYEDWTIRERERLEQVYLNALHDLTVALEGQGELERAVEYGQRIVQIAPLEEEAHGDLMRLYAALGQPTAVRKQYDQLKAVLRRELDEEPSRETQALFERLTQTSSVPPRAAAKPLPTPVRPIERATPRPSEEAPLERSRTEILHLPLNLTRFFGREEEIRRLQELLTPSEEGYIPSRLITLTGPGGSGKTRLATEAVRTVSAHYDSIWFVGLSEIHEAGMLPDAILKALSIPQSPHAEPLDLLVQTLEERSILLLMDNFEQIAEAGAEIVQEILERLPALVCLITSRQRLDLGGEQEFAVNPLPTPKSEISPERLIAYPSVQLYVDRARSGRPDFQLTAHNAAAISALCARLEGIPLAIELAASWAATISPAQTLSRLEGRLELLSSRRRDLPSRHQTLRATIEWSYRLLSPELQSFFACLSVFRGGWTLEAAQEVCEEPDALDYLQQLRDRSLILSEEFNEAMRYRLLESLREFAAEALPIEESREERERHLHFYVALVEESVHHRHGPEEREWMEKLDADLDNIRAALDFALEATDGAELGLRLMGSLAFYWRVKGHLAEGRRRYAAALNRPGAEKPTLYRANSLSGAGTLAHIQGDDESARKLLQENVNLRRDLGDRQGLAGALNNLGLIALGRGDAAEAQPLFEESLVLSRETGSRLVEAVNLHNLAILASDRGDLPKARELFEACVALQREINNPRGVAMSLTNLAQALCLIGDLEAARTALVEGLQLNLELGDMHYSTYLLEMSSLLLDHWERLPESVRLLGTADTYRKRMGSPIPVSRQGAHVTRLANLREQLGEDAFAAAWSAGQALTLDEAMEFAQAQLKQAR